MALPHALSRTLAVLLAAGIAVALYAAVFFSWVMLTERANATCRALVEGEGSYSITPIWRGGVAWDCEYETVWNPRGTVVLSPDDLGLTE